jgi:hypothetical protein
MKRTTTNPSEPEAGVIMKYYEHDDNDSVQHGKHTV